MAMGFLGRVEAEATTMAVGGCGQARDFEKWDDDILNSRDVRMKRCTFNQSGEFPSPKKERTTSQEERGGGGGGGGEEEEQVKAQSSDGVGDDHSISVTLTDPYLFDCPVCFENLSIPVFQCHNGHLACSSCCSKRKLGIMCPFCCSPIGLFRCWAIEQILESLKVSCGNMKYGCKEMVFYCQKHDHQDKCIYAPCSCPLHDCGFNGSSKNIFLHFSNKHSNSAKSFFFNFPITISLDKRQKYVIFQEQEEGTLFILNNRVEVFGNLINVNCIARSTSKTGFPYDLQVEHEDSSVKLQSSTEFVPLWGEHTPLKKRYLVVPSDFVDSCGKIKLELRIMMGSEPPAIY